MHTKFHVTKQLIQPFALHDYSRFNVLTNSLLANFTLTWAYSMLKSILSSIVPYSTTRVESSLNTTAKSFI